MPDIVLPVGRSLRDELQGQEGQVSESAGHRAAEVVMKKIPIADLPQHIPQGWELEDGRKLDWWRFERLHIHYPPEPYRLLYYSRGLARLFHDEDEFEGATLWLTDW